ncbi:MAG: DUF192 domain-containing protein [Candidatus Omnitrophica bacterium]|nr:DUF192 domain-containing protein [Candidatus Omnitrophota bacterium]
MADTAVSRLVGLLNRKHLPQEEALVITDCRSIHMFFMRFAIDVIFADKNKKVVGLVKNIKPFFMSPYFFRAYYAIEASSGVIELSKTQLGDSIVFEELRA